ncbi:unnamed protein product, partial [Didymodactylos carnosus]
MINEITELIPTWNPDRLMMDFQKASMNAFGGSFPQAIGRLL